MYLYNAHTHIFTTKCIPENFLGKGLIRIISIPLINKLMLKLLRQILPGQSDFLSKYANFLAIGSNKNQEAVFRDLVDSYDDTCRFVVLTLDMDHMGAGRAEVNYNTQLYEVLQLKLKYMQSLLPFVSVDPRRGTAQELLALVKKYVEEYGFVGIKLYPALGFYPFDPNLDLVYQYAEANEIPLMTHCTKAGVYYKGKTFSEQQIWPKDLDGKQLPQNDHRKSSHLKNRHFKNFFTDPDNYRQVLSKYPKLKICIAHYGGSTEIERFYGKRKKKDEVNGLGNFYEKTRKLLEDKKFPNVRTDISYTLAANKIFPELIADIKNSDLRDNILFGTDYFMTIIEKNERKLVSEFRQAIDAKDFSQIANANVKSYLNSSFFTA